MATMALTVTLHDAPKPPRIAATLTKSEAFLPKVPVSNLGLQQSEVSCVVPQLRHLWTSF